MKEIDFIFATFFKGLGLKKAAVVLPRLLFFVNGRSKKKVAIATLLSLKV